MDGIRGKRTTKPNESPAKRKRGNATEAASNVSHIDSPQPKTIGWNKSKRGRAARWWGNKLKTRLRLMTSRWLLSSRTRHNLPKSWPDQTQTQNSTEPLIRRGDIAGLAQEVVRHLRAINSTAGAQRQEPSDSTERPMHCQNCHHRVINCYCYHHHLTSILTSPV